MLTLSVSEYLYYEITLIQIIIAFKILSFFINYNYGMEIYNKN